MSTIQEAILEGFLKELKEKTVDDALVDALRALFDADGKVKAEELVAAYETTQKGGTT